MRITQLLLCLCLFLFSHCQIAQENVSPNTFSNVPNNKICGLNFVAPPNAFSNDPMIDVQQVSADWIAVIPYAYTRKGMPTVSYNVNIGWQQWWGERPEGVTETIRLAKKADLKIMLKPQVYVPGSWTGDLDFKSQKDWEAWEADYEAYILPFAEMADSMQVDMFCIGTEFKKSVVKREAFWRALIDKIKTRYTGQLIYAANWDEYETVPFWDALDFAGINAYFPLVNEKTPKVKTLVNAWLPHKKEIAAFYKKIKKPIVFTEFGYLSVDGCAYNTWELEGKIKQLAVNEEAQANALDAIFEAFWNEPYWAGSFLWKWFPNNKGHEGYLDKDYTPQHKKGEQILKKWYEIE